MSFFLSSSTFSPNHLIGWVSEEILQTQLSGHEQTLGDSEGWGSLAGCSPWSCKESDTAEQLNDHKRQGQVLLKFLSVAVLKTAMTKNQVKGGKLQAGGNVKDG